MRGIDYTTIALKNLRRQTIRSLLTVIALVISTVILVVMTAISIGGRQAIADQFGSDASLTMITVTPNQSSASLSPYGNVQEVKDTAKTLDDHTVAQLGSLPHAAMASPRAQLWEWSSFTLGDNTKQFVANAQGAPADASLTLKAGRQFQSNDEKNVVVVGYAYAKELGYAQTPDKLVGQTLSVTTQQGYRGIGAAIPAATADKQTNDAFNQTSTTLKATVVGVTAEGPDQNGLFVPIGWAHDIRTAHYNTADGLKTVDQLATNGYSSVIVHADNQANVKALGASIDSLGYGETSTLSQVENIQQFSVTMWVILGAVAAVAIVAAALGVMNTMLMAVSEQRYAIGVWRACGAKKSFIVKLFLVESGLLGFIGGVVGVAVGLIVSHFVNEYVNSLLKGQGLALTDITAVPLWLMGATVILTTLFGILAGLYPAYRAARQDPSLSLTSGQ